MSWIVRLNLLAILLLLTHETRSQDSLVFFRDLRFTSPFERNAFYKYVVGRENDAFSLLIADGALLTDEQVMSARKDFYAFLDEINTTKFQSKSQEQRTKTLVKALAPKYFKKYQAYSRFEDLIHRGEYAEVSGSALYGLALDYLRIPYNIQEAPNNVFVLACPGSKQIMLESTVTSLIMTTYDQTFKKNFIESLKKQKLISEDEFAKSSVNSLFDKYYLRSADLFTLQALAGLQYFEHGMSHVQQQNSINAFQCFEKAFYLSPTPRNAYMVMQAGLALFSEMKVRNNQHAVLLGKLSRYEGLGINEEIISGEFQHSINSLLFDRGKKEDLDQYYEALIENCPNAAIKREVSFVYNHELGRYKYNDMRYNEALPYFEAALKLKPTNQPAASSLISCLSNLTRFSYQDESTLKQLEQYSTTIPELNNNNMFLSMLGSCYLAHMAISFQSKKQSLGESHRKKFETLQAAHPEMKLPASDVGRAYSDASVYYFQKGQNTKAKECIAAGLKISPNNYELINRQKMIR